MILSYFLKSSQNLFLSKSDNLIPAFLPLMFVWFCIGQSPNYHKTMYLFSVYQKTLPLEQI